ncbi:tetratricopeptide repeat protein [Kordiimonas aestuarii]|uniref:tetratricopeptide repeat protein n=1 Tax=Kordiimonas aestuarii TaxID=1005925 RepID=UPI0021CF1241|nr:tetratricopeptide repeat protein [Kordiimonas aestuarii]
MNRIFLIAAAGLISAGFAAAEAQTFHLAPDRNLVKGNAALAAGELEDALGHLRKAVQKNITERERITTYNSICAVENILGNPDAAVQACDAAIAGDSHYWKAFVNRGNARAATGDHAGALSDYCRAHDLSPDQVSGTFEERCNAQS